MKKTAVVLMSFAIIAFCWLQEAVAAPPMVLGDAEIVPYRHWEIWLSFNYRETEEKEIYKTPTLEIIYGLVPRVELGIEGTYIMEDEDGDRIDGLDSLATQVKVLLAEETQISPAVCAGLQYEVPTDEDKDDLDWEEDVWAPALALQKHFGNTLLVGQVKYFVDEKWRYGADIMYAWSKRLKLLGEVYAESLIDSDKKDELNFRLGFKYKFMENAKVYFAAGRSLITAEANRPRFEANGGVMIEF